MKVKLDGWRDSVVKHPIVFAGTLVWVGFLAGAFFGSQTGFLNGPIPAPEANTLRVNTCEALGFEKMEENHHARILPVQTEIARFENRLGNELLGSFEEDQMKKSVRRLRDDIALENKSYQSAISKLTIICK